MKYLVKEIYYTLQGEGAHAGRPAVFCRFAGCNLWSGREADRVAAVCRFCDTDFVGIDGPGGGRFDSPAAFADAVAAIWTQGAGPIVSEPRVRPYVVCIGGEPLLQLDESAIAALHSRGFEVGVETNGTRPVPAGIDWLCVSPKADADLVVTSGDELKLVFPQPDAPPERYAALDFEHFYLQPMDAPGATEGNIRSAVDYCLAHPQWKLSLQTHKILRIP